MNTLDSVLDALSRSEPPASDVQAAQRQLEAAIASAPRRRARPSVGGWLAAAASAVVAVAVFVGLPLTPSPALAFATVQKHFRDFETLRFDLAQRMDGDLIMSTRVSLLADGSVRTEAGDDVVVVVNPSEQRVLTLIEPGRIAMVTPLAASPSRDESLGWLEELREFQGTAVALPDTRTIRGQSARGWRLPMEGGEAVLWANEAGLPLEMQMDLGMKLELSFTFDFDVILPAELFSTEPPAGYTLQAPNQN